VQTVNLALSKSFGAHAAEATPTDAKRPRISALMAALIRRAELPRRPPMFFIVAEQFMRPDTSG
jgi:hypothetical protein